MPRLVYFKVPADERDGDERFDSFASEGTALSTEDALELGLAGTDSPPT